MSASTVPAIGANEIEEQERTGGLWQPVDLAAVWGCAPELEYVVPGLVGRQEVGLLASETGAGKTHVLMNWAVALAGGQPVMGWCEVTDPARVVYVDREMGTREFMRRLERHARGMGIPPEDLFQNLMLFTPDWPADNPLAGAPLSMDERGSIREFQNKVRAFAPALVILDTFIGLYGGEENSNDEVRRWYNDVLVPMRSAGASIILAHHFNKAGGYVVTRSSLDRVRGASDLTGFSEKVWVLERSGSAVVEDGLRRVEAKLNNLKARRGDAHEDLRVSIEDIELADGVGTHVEAIEAAPGTHTDRVVRWLEEAREDGLLRKEINDRLVELGVTPGAADKATTRARRDLKRLGRLREAREGNAKRYFLAEHAREEERTGSD